MDKIKLLDNNTMTEISDQKPFKILSIDGGGIRGIFPAKILAELEAKLRSDGKKKWQIYQNFDLICGTSTGGILAIALSLGIPASELHDLYIQNAQSIFGQKKNLIRQFRYAAYERDALENLIRTKFSSIMKNKNDPRLKDCMVPICIPIYDLFNGQPSILKNDYHPRFTRDFHIPAYKAALATSAAPTYFSPYSSEYTDLHGLQKTFSNKVDGGIIANNPTLLGIIEAQEAFKQDLSNLRVLSLGTGHQKFSDGESRKKWGIWYWIRKDKKKRLIELFMQGQSQIVENLISLMQNGIDKERVNNPSFTYKRINTELNDTLNIEMDETNVIKLKKLSERGSFEFNNHASEIIELFCK
ncbi:CBASS cGAMP-activated phospholipase [Fluviicola taffensis]|uniref:Patatin n=1 Tax=Fluviicola taffensis (strain DSM 16823 / NCIMB 13979 / RW262) TaxID=755732 RepID=F2IEW5_FLUTR|nr:CBASS cGAMP-activated phospholipase [Fluviicola taffensis]AEA42430.1 Patatin [Fluviicola taffensis DSM 16823]